MRRSRGTRTFTVPLDGIVSFNFDMYATVLAATTASPVASYVRNYVGSSRLRSRRGVSEDILAERLYPR